LGKLIIFLTIKKASVFFKDDGQNSRPDSQNEVSDSSTNEKKMKSLHYGK